MARFRWTPARDFDLLGLLDRGFTLQECANRLGTSFGSARHRARKLGASVSELDHVTINSMQTEFLSCAHPYRVRLWVKRRWLGRPTTSRSPGGQKFCRFRREQLEAFLEVEEGWVAWEPDELIPRDIREWATEMRAAVPWRWVRSREAMQALGYSDQYCSSLIQKGALDRSKCVRYGNAWYVRSDEVERFRRDELPHRAPGPLSLAAQTGMAVRVLSPLLTERQIALFAEWGEGDPAEGVRRVADYLLDQQQRRSA